MKLLFIRHAIAEDRSPGGDMKTKLTDEGRKKAKAAFRGVAALYPETALIISSQAIRARETADILAQCLGTAEVLESDLLNPGAFPDSFRSVLSGPAKGHEIVALVGHEPDFSHVISQVVADGGLRLDVKKASCVEVDMHSPGKGELKFMAAPRVLACIRAE